MLPFLSNWMSLGRESPFHKVIYGVTDMAAQFDRNQSTMSIPMVNDQPFLRHSIVWWQICHTYLYWTLFKQRVILKQMSPISSFLVLNPMIKNAWLILSYEQMTRSRVCKFYWETDLRKGQEWKILD